MKNLFVAVVSLLAIVAVNAQESRQELRKDRAEVRMQQNEAAAVGLNKGIEARNWEFIPNSYQAPYIGTKFVYQNYYVQMYPTYVQVWMPYVSGFPYSSLTPLNFDTSSVQNYQISPIPNGYHVSFYVLGEGVNQYTFQFSINTVLNDATLIISTPMGVQVTYSGSIVTYAN